MNAQNIKESARQLTLLVEDYEHEAHMLRDAGSPSRQVEELLAEARSQLRRVRALAERSGVDLSELAHRDLSSVG